MRDSPRNAIDAWAWLIECDLATLEELEMLKSSSKARIDRQRGICERAVREFRMLGNADAARFMKAMRLVDALEGT